MLGLVVGSRHATASKCLLSPWTDCDSQGEGCGERKQKWKGGVAGLCGPSRPVDILLLRILS